VVHRYRCEANKWTCCKSLMNRVNGRSPPSQRRWADRRLTDGIFPGARRPANKLFGDRQGLSLAGRSFRYINDIRFLARLNQRQVSGPSRQNTVTTLALKATQDCR
jgi:hypothetical protein